VKVIGEYSVLKKVISGLGRVIGLALVGYIRLLRRTPWYIALAAVVLTFGTLGYGTTVLLGMVDDLPGNTYAEGWRMGQLTHYAMEGNPLVKTGEALFMHGSNSSAGQIKRGDKVVFENPGHLSSSRSVHDQYAALTGEYVAIRYREVKVQLTSMNGDTDYRILEIVKVDATKAPEKCGVLSDDENAARGVGVTVGYMVRVSEMGNLLKSQEAVMQMGNASGTFMELSISDPMIAACAEAFVKAGVPVKVHYTQSLIRDPLTANTTKDIVGISRGATLPAPTK
jgi:hypothetical protein